MSDLSAALQDVLEKRGVLSEVRAKLRAEVYKSLDDQSSPKPQLCRENFLLNELIRDYLSYNQYNYTQSVLIAESGQPQNPLERDFLAQELNLKDAESLPLLYRMLHCFLQDSELERTQERRPPSCPVAGPGVGERKRTAATCSFEEPTYHSTS